MRKGKKKYLDSDILPFGYNIMYNHDKEEIIEEYFTEDKNLENINNLVDILIKEKSLKM